MHHVQSNPACCFHPMTTRSRGYQDVHKFLHVCMRHCCCSAPIPSTPSRSSPGSTICLQHGRLIAAAFVDYLMRLDVDASCDDKALQPPDHVPSSSTELRPRRPRPEQLRRAPTTSTTRPRRNDDRREERRYDNRDHSHDDRSKSSRTGQLHRQRHVKPSLEHRNTPTTPTGRQ